MISADMSATDQPLNALQNVPALLAWCKTEGVLKQSRSLNAEARRLATYAVTTFQLHLGNASEQAGLQRMQQICKPTQVLLVAGNGTVQSDSWRRSATGAIPSVKFHFFSKGVCPHSHASDLLMSAATLAMQVCSSYAALRRCSAGAQQEQT